MPGEPLSAANPKIKRLRRLSGRRSSRVEEGAFVIEGPVLVREAIAAGIEPEAVFVDAAHAHLVADLRREAALHEAAVHVVAVGVLASVLPTVSPQPICAVAPLGLVRPLDDVVTGAVVAARPLLVLVDVGDPGNAGTLLRAAEASGAAGVLFAGSSVEVTSPKVVRASAGSAFRVPVAVEDDAVAALGALQHAGVPAMAAVAHGGDDHTATQLGGAVALVLGNEAHGLSGEQVAACAGRVTIALDGPAESLNVAMAGTVLLFEALRQRRGG